jgi:hypothetical protein
VKVVRTFKTPIDAPLTVPHPEHLYDGREFGEEFTATVTVVVKGGAFQAPATVAVDVAPAVDIAEVAPSPAILISATGSADPTKRIGFRVKLVNDQLTTFDGTLLAASGITHERTDQVAVRLAAGESKTVTMMVQQPPPGNRAPANKISFILQSSSANPPYKTVPVVYADAHVAANLRVGYVRGFDFSLPNALNALGVESKELSVDDVKTADLQNDHRR